MRILKMQLNTPAAVTRDLEVNLTNQVSGEKRTVRPYLDGSVAVPNIPAGDWRMQIKHPNLLFDLQDRNIRIFPDRPTFVPIRIPTDIFENAPIQDTPEADLGPVQERLEEAAEAAGRQAGKLGGQPIYAGDWNDMATTVEGVARSTKDLTELVSATGHDHPELVAKMDEIQGNLQRLFEVFGSSIAQLQRQIHQLALQRKVETALDRVPDVPAATRRQMEEAVRDLTDVWQENPSVYSARKRRAARSLQDQLGQLLIDQTQEVRDDPQVRDLDTFTLAMASEQPVVTYEAEIQQQQRTSRKSSTGIVFDALQAGARGGSPIP